MKYLVLVLKGIAYGITHIVPGIGGGLILLIMGIYEQFVDSIGNLFIERHKWREHLSFLVPLGVGTVIGMVALAKIITLVMERWPVPTMFFFMGLLLGTLPPVLKMHHDMRPSLGRVGGALLGLGLVVLTRLLQPSDAAARTVEALGQGSGILYNVVVSFLSGGASVTPGLDGSYGLLLGGTYDAILQAISDLLHFTIHWSVLIPFGLAAVSGIFVVSKAIDVAIKRIPSLSYYFVMGMILGSVYGLWPRQGVAEANIIVLIVAFVVGGAVALLFGGPQDQPAA